MQPAIPQPTEHVFLSYNHNDRAAAIALRAALEKAGLTVFKDDDSLRGGDRWLERLQQVLNGCSAFVVLAGRDGVRRWVGAEVQVALIRHLSPEKDEERLPIFPILLEEALPETLPPFLALFQASRWTGAGALPTGLVDAISAHAIRLDSPPAIEGCPFVGLNAFSSKDARLFFGRRRETLEALTCLGDQQQTNPEGLRGGGGGAYCRWLQIEGNSGTGKSSLVNAGMLPMIERGVLWARTGFEHWTLLGPMMPGKDPLTRLAEVVEHGLISDQGRRNMLARQQAFEGDERALAFALRDFREEPSAFLLIVDQFEELFTFADAAASKQFDALLANALQDAECPLFLISTVRADFLDHFEQLPRLQKIYNSYCKRYFLPAISEHGLREVIEQPARFAGLDVSEVSTAIIEDARDEIGALPLVENALFTLWQQREGQPFLSGERYRQLKGIAGMLSTQADELLRRIDGQVSGGQQRALELLLSLTRINDEGRHTRQRIAREEALMIAGDGKPAVGERVLQLLSGERRADAPAQTLTGALRLITISEESREDKRLYVDLIHETLIRARGKDEQTGKTVGYWPTLYDYIETNRDRDMLRQQLRFQAERWGKSRAVGRWWNLAGWDDLWRYRKLRVSARGADDCRFVFWSRCAAWVDLGLLLAPLALLSVIGESALWAVENKLPRSYILQKPLWLLGYGPLPEMVEVQPGSFTMGCVPGRDDVASAKCDLGEIGHQVTLSKAFALGKYEVTFLEYDYYVWDQKRRGKEIEFPLDGGWGRADRPVINVSWGDATAYTQWLSEKSGKHYRLPTEAEWEYAARAGTNWPYWWGNEFVKDKSNCDGSQTTPVRGSYPPNPWGLHDTSGNVYEWVNDWYAPYSTDAVTDPLGPSEGVSRALRGGSWYYNPRYCSAATREDLAQHTRGNGIGFRVYRGSPIESLPVDPLNTVQPKR
ncbi:MAG: TIR domain-containing protein [Candidatus Accumulibacter meliphilus]|jgi:formylglycine-generating enzyme required for sulfatase activity|uniref:TIR domain-containing protein n=1 Tax=Candidatus Accumulibacter meliphilus TaxID=2211374 RepID=A0A369XPV0_9PROT|nr:MAG: TIR domain-containing protein [Candidatus Accumulibacter meliphilus]